MLAKVKNHAIVQRGLLVSAGRSDYIHAGTQVLLNTCPLSHLNLTAPAPPRSLFSFITPCSLQVQSRYKWLFAVQLPQHVFLPLLVPNSVLNTKQKKKKGRL